MGVTTSVGLAKMSRAEPNLVVRGLHPCALLHLPVEIRFTDLRRGIRH